MSNLAAVAAVLLLARAIFPEAHGASSLEPAGEVDVITARADAEARMTVPVRIGEHGPYRFLVDTGAQNTVVSSDIAARLALPTGARATVIGVAGQVAVDTVRIEEFGLGRRSYYNLTAPLLDGANIGADGIVGVDSLQEQRILIDFKRNLIAIDQAAYQGGNSGFEIVVRARRRSGQLIVTQATIDGVRTDVVIDTGAENSIGNRALQRALSRRGLQGETTLTSVTGQQVQAQIGIGQKLSIGAMDISNVLLAFTDAPPFAALDLVKRPAMLLGMRELRLFDRVAIDFPTRKVLFDMATRRASNSATR